MKPEELAEFFALANMIDGIPNKDAILNEAKAIADRRKFNAEVERKKQVKAAKKALRKDRK